MYSYVCVWVFAAAVPLAFCQNKFCSAHEFCGEKISGGETRCVCRAIFASKYRSTNTFGTSAMTQKSLCYYFLAWVSWRESCSDL